MPVLKSAARSHVYDVADLEHRRHLATARTGATSVSLRAFALSARIESSGVRKTFDAVAAAAGAPGGAPGRPARRRRAGDEQCTEQHQPRDDGPRAVSVAQPALPRTNSTKKPTGTPVGPFGSQVRSLSVYAVPAMSRCTHGYSSANSFRNSAALIVPAGRPPEFLMSATSDLDQFLVLVPQRQRPAGLAGALSRVEHFLHQRVVVAHHAGRGVAERDDAGAGERRRVDHRGRREAAARSSARRPARAALRRRC